jgi:starch-binding outer membrane protein, SusD/RagB family
MRNRCVIISLVVLLVSGSCKKLVQVDEPVNSITTTEVFSTNAQANSALAGIYTQMINNTVSVFSEGGADLYGGLSADELSFPATGNALVYQFSSNTLNSNNSLVSTVFWAPAYSDVYGANAAIQGLSKASGVTDSARSELLGEAEFVRAFCYFYLTNWFGDVPLVLTTNYNQTNLVAKTPQNLIYNQIVSDLQDAQKRLPPDFSVGLGERVRPNKWAATALLARVYLYQKNWKGADSASAAVIGNSQFSLSSSVSGVFLANSSEAIWQLQQNTSGNTKNATQDGYLFVPSDSTIPPSFPLTNELVQAFDSGDARKTFWVGFSVVGGDTLYYPTKYTLNADQAVTGQPAPQYFMVLRLAEQFLIRAESEAQTGNFVDATSDLNAIRNRAGLPNYDVSIQGPLLSAILHERQVEFFLEWGNRWFDLIRSGQAISVLSQLPGKSSITTEAFVYPIPYSELVANPNLTQNKGY